MADGFREMRGIPTPKVEVAGLREDWTSEENRFRAGIGEFLDLIAPGNPVLESPRYGFSEKELIAEPQKPAVIGLASNDKKPEKNPKEHVSTGVEYMHARGTECEPPALQPTQPTQPRYNLDTDPFDASPVNKTAKAPADVFDVGIDDPFASIVSSPEPTPAAAEQPQAMPTSEPSSAAKKTEASDELDLSKLKDVLAVADAMLAGLPDIDLDIILASLGDYSVSLDLDHLRENPSVLTDKLLEIQSKRDSLHALNLKLTPAYYAMKHAASFFETCGPDCSTASSREKRMSQVKMSSCDFWIRQAKLNRTNETVEKTFQHLEGQYECISRLITGAQIKAKMHEINRGEFPYEPKPRQTAVTSVIPQPPKGPPPKDVPDDDVTNRDLSQPSVSNKAFKGCEDFVPIPKTAPKKSNFASCEVDF